MHNLPVVSNTTPLISLAGIRLLELLPLLYGQIHIAEVVRTEYQAGALATEPNLDTLPWMQIHSVKTDPTLRTLLDAGEAATITLAHTLHVRVAILDEARGRRIAQQQGLPIIGTLGVLLRAKEQGFLTSIKSSINEMIAQGRRISPALRAEVLQSAGEGELF